VRIRTSFRDEGLPNKLSWVKCNLVSPAQRFLELGVKVKKEITKSVLDGADVEAIEVLGKGDEENWIKTMMKN